MMNAVKKRAELYDDWASLVMETLEAKLEKKKGKCQTQKKKLDETFYNVRFTNLVFPFQVCQYSAAFLLNPSPRRSLTMTCYVGYDWSRRTQRSVPQWLSSC